MKKILAGITPDNEIYFLEIEPRSKEHDYFSMSGFSVRPLKFDDAVNQSRESLEDGELWKMAVTADQTTLGLNDWADYVLSIDGEISQVDNSLVPDEIEVDGTDYIFESGAYGQHEEKTLKHYFIEKKLFNELMTIWEKYHLKKAKPKLPELPSQNIPGLLEKAVRLIEGGEDDNE